MVCVSEKLAEELPENFRDSEKNEVEEFDEVWLDQSNFSNQYSPLLAKFCAVENKMV